ncbi:MAG: restriction endonuclease subunit S [Methanobrevibacter sp.]|jgi:type I restriction enzyme S subunit|nr:restriction endonuclease subunit S [Candidatus Methanovirga procula]
MSLNIYINEFPEKIRKSILQEAIQGKLTEQDPNDEPASILLEKIRKEKEKLIKENKIKRNRNEGMIYKENGYYYEKIGKEINCIDDEIPFDIPENWAWCRIQSLGEIVGGGTPKTKVNEYWVGGTIPWLTPADMKNIKGKFASKGKRNITQRGLERSSAKLMPKNTIIYSSRAPIGYIAIASNELSTNQGFKSLTPINSKIVNYIYYCLKAMTPKIQSRASGTTFKEISGAEFGKILISLPPLEEQKRIVEEIEKIYYLH